jgi:hypothetical protein
MWNLSKILSALWGLLGIIALVTLFFVYTNFNSRVLLGTMDWGISLDKQRFFSVFCSLYLLVNLITFIAIRTISGLKSKVKPLLTSLQLPMLVALKTMVVGANIFLIILMLYVSSTMTTNHAIESWQWLAMMVGPVIILAGLIYLAIILVKPIANS